MRDRYAERLHWLSGRLPLLILALLSPALLRGQPAAALTLRIVADSVSPIDGYMVTLRQGRERVERRADSLGVAMFAGLAPGEVDIDVRAVGIKPLRARFLLAAGSNSIEVRATRQRIELSAVNVIGDRSVPPRLQDFERRRALGEPNGVIDRADIERVNPVAITVLLGRLPGVRVYDSLGVRKLISRRGFRLVGGALVPCQLRVMLDGILLPLDFNLDQVPPVEVYGVEVYLGSARLPLQFGSLRENSQCGMVLIWTRSG